MALHYELISSVRSNTENWVVRVTVMECLPVITLPNNSAIHRYILVDLEGNQVMASVHGVHVEGVVPQVNHLDVIDIAGAQVVRAHSAHRVVAHEYEWVFDERTTFDHILHERPNFFFVFADVTPLAELHNTMSRGARVANVMGILIWTQRPIHQRESSQMLQRFLLVDNGNHPVSVVLWNTLVHQYQPMLTGANRRFAVVIGRRLQLSSYGGVSLSVNYNSSFIIDPEGGPAQWMRGWFEAVAEVMMPMWLGF